MKFQFITASLFALVPLSATAEELVGATLLGTISGQHYDCLMGEVPLEWVLSDVKPDAITVPYTAIVHGKSVESEYTLSDAGRLTSDGYGDERQVHALEDGTLTISRSDGRVMTCNAR